MNKANLFPTLTALEKIQIQKKHYVINIERTFL